MPYKPFLERLAEEKRRERLESLLAELADQMRELESLLARITETYGRLTLLLELEKKQRDSPC